LSMVIYGAQLSGAAQVCKGKASHER